MRRLVLPRSALRLIGPLTVLVTWELAARFGLVNTIEGGAVHEDFGPKISYHRVDLPALADVDLFFVNRRDFMGGQGFPKVRAELAESAFHA